MKKEIHPEYREVVFLDAAANFSFLTRSTVKTSQTLGSIRVPEELIQPILSRL